MNDRRHVQLADGRVGKVVRVDTTFPGNAITVSVWTSAEDDGPDSQSPGICRVSLSDVVGEAARQSA